MQNTLAKSDERNMHIIVKNKTEKESEFVSKNPKKTPLYKNIWFTKSIYIINKVKNLKKLTSPNLLILII